MTGQRAAVAAVWAATVVGVSLVIALTAGAETFTWLALALVLSVVAAIVAQLLVGEQHGFVVRLATTTAGSFVIVLLAAGAALLLG